MKNMIARITEGCSRICEMATKSADCVVHRSRVSQYASKHGRRAVRLLLALGLLCTSFSALALPSNDPGDPDGMDQHCLPEIKVSGQPRLVGFALVGQTVSIDATHVKLVNVGDFCGDFGHALGPGDFQWKFFLPPV